LDLTLAFLAFSRCCVTGQRSQGKQRGANDHQLGHELRITTFAEGIESLAKVNFRADLVCDVGQGYLFYKPMNAAQLRAILVEAKEREQRA